MSIARTFTALTLFLAAGSAMAHGGHGGSFAAGVVHPFSGLDHILAMLAVGLYAGRQEGALRWALPAGFVGAMLLGAMLGAHGHSLPAIEGGVAASLLILGLMIAFVVRLPLAAALALIGTMAVFHGLAHQAEMGAGSLASYAAGFAIATAALHLAGIVLARWMPQSPTAQILKRALGGGIAATGLVLLGN